MLRVSRRPKRRGLAIFLVPEVVIEIAAMAVPTRLALVNDTVDNRAPRRLRLRNPWRGRDKWWRWRVTLPHDAACKAGAFLVCHIPVACCLGTAPSVGGFGDLPAHLVRNM